MVTVWPAVAFADTVSVPVAAVPAVLADAADAFRFIVSSTLAVALGAQIWPLAIWRGARV